MIIFLDTRLSGKEMVLQLITLRNFVMKLLNTVLHQYGSMFVFKARNGGQAVKILDDISKDMKARAQKEFDSKIHESTDLEEAAKIIKAGKGIVRAGWCSDEACAGKIEKMDIAVLGLMDEGAPTDCIVCKGKTKVKIQMGKSY